MLLAGLSTGHKIGLVVVAGVFIAFSLVSSFVAPRRNPDFPGRGAGVYYLATVVLFVLMIGAVEVFGAASEQAAGGTTAVATGQQNRVDVTETEYRIQLPSSTAQTLSRGTYVFHVVNKGKAQHSLVVTGPRVSGASTKILAPGESADLRVKLTTGTYELFCAVDGHKQLGMDAKLSVG